MFSIKLKSILASSSQLEEIKFPFDGKLKNSKAVDDDSRRLRGKKRRRDRVDLNAKRSSDLTSSSRPRSKT